MGHIEDVFSDAAESSPKTRRLTQEAIRLREDIIIE